MDRFFDKAAAIIEKASKSRRGIVALVVLVLPTLAYLFFREESVWIKAGIFVLLLLGGALAVYAVYRRWTGLPEDKRGESLAEPSPSPTIAPPLPDPPDGRVSLRLPITGGRLFGREVELARLDEAWADTGTNVISLVASGGVGKSALVNDWLATLATERHRGARRVYGRSFYSQGARDTVASADTFIDEALRWFGDPDPETGSPWQKGERLAALVRKQRTLLVLDGLEPLQHPPGPEEGLLKDPALSSLLRGLAADNAGLCVVTTRVRVADIEAYEATTAPKVELDNLSDQAGAALLRSLEVEGSEDELRLASREVGGHGLALNLLGTYLRDVCECDVRRRSEIRGLTAHAEQGGHARRVMESYEIWLGDGPELHVLRLLGLFDRPADGGSVAALRRPPAIAGLTDRLIAADDSWLRRTMARLRGVRPLDEPSWRRALARLRRAWLLTGADPDDPDALDAHPLVREHFRDRLRDDHGAAWRAGNDRLYQHLTETADDLPDTIAALAPLFAAVAHGCASGRHQEAYDEVFIRRIRRGDEFFSVNKLGAWGADLAALSGFFDPPYARPVLALREADRAFVLNDAGLGLRALGRLEEAVAPMRAALEAVVAREDWQNAARGTGSLSELHLILGELQAALGHAEQSVEYADHGGEAAERMLFRTTLADALHQAGRVAEAAALFAEAEEIQKEWQPHYPLLYSVQGYQYCDLLLDRGEHGATLGRAAQII